MLKTKRGCLRFASELLAPRGKGGKKVRDEIRLTWLIIEAEW